MDYPKKIEMPFAAQGEYNVIPVQPAQQGEGFASFAEGFPPELSLPFSQSGKAVKRLDFNGILNSITQFQIYQQSGGMFNYDSTVNYDPPALVWVPSQQNYYKCIESNGPSSTVMAPQDDSEGRYWQAFGSSADISSLWNAVNGKANVNHTHTASQITGLANVRFLNIGSSYSAPSNLSYLGVVVYCNAFVGLWTSGANVTYTVYAGATNVGSITLNWRGQRTGGSGHGYYFSVGKLGYLAVNRTISAGQSIVVRRTSTASNDSFTVDSEFCMVAC